MNYVELITYITTRLSVQFKLRENEVNVVCYSFPIGCPVISAHIITIISTHTEQNFSTLIGYSYMHIYTIKRIT